MDTPLEKLRCCCKNNPVLLILFDGGETPDLPITVCNRCSKKSIFQRFVKSREAIYSNLDIEKSILSLNKKSVGGSLATTPTQTKTTIHQRRFSN